VGVATPGTSSIQPIQRDSGTTFYNGTVNGKSWNATGQRAGNTTFYNGTDVRGRSFNYTCMQAGRMVTCQ